MAAKKSGPGRVRSFTEAETEALRALARKLKNDNGWNGTRLGEAMGGIKQQNASRFVAEGSTSGIDRTTGNALAKAAGFRDVEHALLDAGVMAEMRPLGTTGQWTPLGHPTSWATRDAARRYAITIGYPPAAIDAVCHRYTEHHYTGRNLRWWVDKIVLEAMARRDEAPSEVAHMPAAPAKPSGTEG